MPLVAGVDSSTQSCTVELRDAADGRLVGRGQAPHPATRPPVSEQDPQAWWDALRAALAHALQTSGRRARDVAAISVGAQCHGLVALDAAGRVLRPAKLWNDTTSARQARAMLVPTGAPWWARATGMQLSAALTITKLAWLRDEEPLVLARLASVLLPHDWLTYRLTGRRVTDRSEASGTGYFDTPSGTWRPELLASHVSAGVDWAALLPEVLGPSETAGVLTDAAAAELGLEPGLVVGPGGGDQHLGAVGLGLRTGDVAYSLGTSGVVMSTHDRPVQDASGWVDGPADATGGFLPLVCTLNATKVTDTFARLLGVDLDDLARLALAADPQGKRPVLAAYLDGERSPRRPEARGTLAGISSATTREDVALAAVEGVLLGLARGHYALRRAGVPSDGVVTVTGGGAGSPAYRQVLADLLHSPVRTVDAPDSTARGACVQAAAVLAGADIRDVRHSWTPAVSSVTDPRGEVAHDLRARYEFVAALPGWGEPAEVVGHHGPRPARSPGGTGPGERSPSGDPSSPGSYARPDIDARTAAPEVVRPVVVPLAATSPDPAG